MAPTQKLDKYIPTGCLSISQVESGILPEIWALSRLQRWHRFPHAGDSQEPDVGTAIPTLSVAMKAQLMQSPTLLPFAGLLDHSWIDLEFCVGLGDPRLGIVRVYILPDDVDRRLIDRADPAMRRARHLLFSSLDFSASTWQGECGVSRSPSPRPLQPKVDTVADEEDGGGDDGEEEEEEISLLQMFNSLPSPDPRPSSLDDKFAREVMCSLLDSDVPGLETTLYPYQRRSSALMYQRETQPGQILDPRLLEVVDQHGEAWYCDHVNGVGLRHPRRYEGVRGGILAEQMGSGKTLMCLALILATKDQTARIPDIYQGVSQAVRPRVGSLSDMAAACINRNSVPWKLYFGSWERAGLHYSECVHAIKRNPAWYCIPKSPPRRERRQAQVQLPPSLVWPSSCSLIIVPPNLVDQWKQEIAKHTTDLKVLVLVRKYRIPPVEELVKQDILLISSTRLERLLVEDGGTDPNGSYVLRSPLAEMHFKRCIVDEGHRLGNARLGSKSNLLMVLDFLHFSARWIATGTPSKGLYGVDEPADATPVDSDGVDTPPRRTMAKSSSGQEKSDLRRIEAIATHYLRVRPWANSTADGEDAPADWDVYVMLPRHTSRSSGRKDCLRNTLESLLIRHRLSEIGDLLPSVDEKMVYLDGSYQDKLALNLFSMMIIFNSVQSQRRDMDYFFHAKQRKSLQELVSNLRQASFFGGGFFSPSGILTAVETAEKFLDEKKVPISGADDALLREAIAFGRLALGNKLKEVANLFHEVPLYVSHFPGGLGEAWSLDQQGGDPVCMDARMIRSLQVFLRSSLDEPDSLRELFEDGRMTAKGIRERSACLREQLPALPARTNGSAAGPSKSTTLAGNTGLGEDRTLLSGGSKKKKATNAPSRPGAGAGLSKETTALRFYDDDDVEVAEALARTQIISTVSAKLSYLIDAIVRHQKDEQIIVFYEHDNVAYYLASVLEILQIHHLIYAKSITPERRSQYVTTFNHNVKFRVLLMDITQAAFGLDMRSASRIYFISPVLNPQVEAQAIGRARRISQRRRVAVETLVLRGSLEEVMVARKGALTMAEHHRLKSILDDGPIYQWILNARIEQLPDVAGGEGKGKGKGKGVDGMDGLDRWGDVPGVRETALLSTPLFVFGKGAGREAHPDEDLVMGHDHPRRMMATDASSSAGAAVGRSALSSHEDDDDNDVQETNRLGEERSTDSPMPSNSLARRWSPAPSSPGRGISTSTSALGKRKAGLPSSSHLSSEMDTTEPRSASATGAAPTPPAEDTASRTEEERPVRRVRFADPEEEAE